MKNIIVFLFLNLFAISFSFSQQLNSQIDVESIFKAKSEIYFKFSIKSKSELDFLTRIISIDNVKENEVFAYANRNEFVNFVSLNYNFKLLKHPSEDANLRMLNWEQIKKSKTWNYYPT